MKKHWIYWILFGAFLIMGLGSIPKWPFSVNESGSLTRYYGEEFRVSTTFAQDSVYLYGCTSRTGAILTFSENAYAEINDCHLAGKVMSLNVASMLIIDGSIIVGDDFSVYTTGGGRFDVQGVKLRNNSGDSGADRATLEVVDSVTVSLEDNSFHNAGDGTAVNVQLEVGALIYMNGNSGNGICNFVATITDDGDSTKIVLGWNNFPRITPLPNAWVNDNVSYPGNGDGWIHGREHLYRDTRTGGFRGCRGGDNVHGHAINPDGIDCAFYYTTGGIDLRGPDPFFVMGDSTGSGANVAAGGEPLRTRVNHVYERVQAFTLQVDADTLYFPTGTFDGDWAVSVSVFLTANASLHADDRGLHALMLQGGGNQDTVITRRDGSGGTSGLRYLLRLIKSVVEEIAVP